MNFKIQREDPLRVLSSTKQIVENLRFIEIHEDKIFKISNIISKKLASGLDVAEAHFGEAESLESAVQLIFLEDVVNFCFWAEKGKPKWRLELSKGKLTTGGWYTLTKCFQRALVEKIPILDPDYLMDLDLKHARIIFRGKDNIEIPLLEKRLENLHEAGKVLKEKYNRKFINVLEAARFDAIMIAKLLCQDFLSFRDIANWNGRTIYFLKRAQICAQDFSYLSPKYKDLNIKNVDLLTAFADYKVPQILRENGVISYNNELAELVDNYKLIKSGSQEEIEIRASTIWCVELIRQRLGKYTAADIDNAIWLISQNQTGTKPYHRTYTIYY
ncbi:MAG TPA: queuosine salvage family protein [Patescibacteria group bacterium]|jgi:hypothetical protein|nr:queuosine salvage family protein [Patescibacteria group bacterium]